MNVSVEFSVEFRYGYREVVKSNWDISSLLLMAILACHMVSWLPRRLYLSATPETRELHQ